LAHTLFCLECHALHAGRNLHALRQLAQEQKPQLERPFLKQKPLRLNDYIKLKKNAPLSRKESKVPTANFIDTSAKLSKQFEDFCNLEFNDSSYEPQASMSQNDRKALHILDGSAKLSNAHHKTALLWKNDPPLLMNSKS